MTYLSLRFTKKNRDLNRHKWDLFNLQKNLEKKIQKKYCI